MFEKVNPNHPDKIADRIAGALVDYAYSIENNPKIAVEVLIGHGGCFIISETSVNIPEPVVWGIVERLSGITDVMYVQSEQDEHLSNNQVGKIRCGDNGIFKGVTVTAEQLKLSNIARKIYNNFKSDGKYIINDEKLIICQSNADISELEKDYPGAIINPLGYWTGGLSVDSGATNRKLGSDMGDSITGGGLHGKDLSKADVSVNIYAWLLAQKTGNPVEFCCSIGDTEVNGIPYSEIVETAKKFITDIGGFEKFAEWGLLYG